MVGLFCKRLLHKHETLPVTHLNMEALMFSHNDVIMCYCISPYSGTSEKSNCEQEKKSIIRVRIGEKIFPWDHRLSSLGKPRGAKQ